MRHVVLLFVLPNNILIKPQTTKLWPGNKFGTDIWTDGERGDYLLPKKFHTKREKRKQKLCEQVVSANFRENCTMLMEFCKRGANNTNNNI